MSPTAIERLAAAGAEAGLAPTYVRERLLARSHRRAGRYVIVPDRKVNALLAAIVPVLAARGHWLNVIAGPAESDDDVLALAMQASHDLRAALQLACRYSAFWASNVRLVLDDDSKIVLLHYPVSPSPGRDIAAAVLLGNLVRRLRTACGPDVRPVTGASLRWHPGRLGANLQEVFGVPVEVGADADFIRVDDVVLRHALPRAWGPFYRFFEREARETISGVCRIETTSEQVANVVRDHMVERHRSMLTFAARELGVSTRSLQRRLAEEGTTFLQLVDDTRAKLAKEALSQTTHSVGEIAFTLGFTSPSTFVRAFRRWTGDTPTAWREDMLRS